MSTNPIREIRDTVANGVLPHSAPSGVHVSGGALVIRDYVNSKRSVVEVFEGESDDRRAELLDAILEVGTLAYSRASSQVEFDHLAQEVGHLEASLKQSAQAVQDKIGSEVALNLAALGSRVEALVGSDGTLARLLDPSRPGGVAAGVAQAVREAARSERESLARLLDPRSPTSPMAIFGEQLKSLEAGLDKVRLDMAKAAAEAQGRASEGKLGTAKGGRYEVDALTVFRELAKPYGDVVEKVATETTIDGSKVGDLVITLSPRDTGPNEVKIVAEAKSGKVGPAELARQLQHARERRGAAVALGVYASQKFMPTNFWPVAELNPVDFATVYDPETGDRDALLLAYRIARIAAIETLRISLTGQGVDTQGLRVDLSEAKEKLTALLRLKGELTKMSNEISAAVDKVKARVGTLGTDLEDVLTRMEGRLLGNP